MYKNFILCLFVIGTSTKLNYFRINLQSIQELSKHIWMALERPIV